MRKTVEDFAYGAECVFRGMRIFYSRPKLWPYALPPIFCVMLLYTGIIAAIIFLVVPWSQQWFLGLSFPDWLSWLQSVLNGTAISEAATQRKRLMRRLRSPW